MSNEIGQEATQMLPQVIDSVTTLVYGDLMAEVQGKQPDERNRFWDDTRRNLAPFASTVSDFRRTLVTAKSARERNPEIAYAGATANFMIMSDLVASRILADISFVRTLDTSGGTNYSFNREAKAMIAEMGVEEEVLKDVSTHQVVEAVLTGKLKLEASSTDRGHGELKFIHGEQSLAEMLDSYSTVSVIRREMGEIDVIEELPNGLERRTHIFSTRPNEDDPRGGVFLSIPEPRDRNINADPAYTYIRLWQSETGVIEEEMQNPQPDLTIESAVQRAVLGIEMFSKYNALPFEQRQEVSHSRVYDWAYGRPALWDYTEFHLPLVAYLEQQKTSI